MSMTKEQVINTAIQLENDGIRFYSEAASKSGNMLVKKMFEELADDEKKHIDWIQNFAPDVRTSGEFNRKLYERLKKIFADPPGDIKTNAESADNDIKAIDIAIGMENRSEEEYRRFSDSAGDPEMKKLFSVLAGIERFHANLLKDSKDFLENPQDWFMQNERWTFDGA
jgi:rubrerythrin